MGGVKTIQHCLVLCSQEVGCVSVSHKPDIANCWLKSKEYGQWTGFLAGVNSANLKHKGNDNIRIWGFNRNLKFQLFEISILIAAGLGKSARLQLPKGVVLRVGFSFFLGGQDEKEGSSSQRCREIDVEMKLRNYWLYSHM